MKNFKEFCFKASRALAITIITIFILIALNKILYPFERKPDDNEEKTEMLLKNIREEEFVREFQRYIYYGLVYDKYIYYDDEVLREYIEKKLDIVKYKHNCQFYDEVLLAIEDLEDLEYEYKEKLLDSDDAIKIFKYEFKYKLRERTNNLK